MAAAACFWPLVRHPREILVGPQRGGLNDLTLYFIACRNYPRQCLDRFGQFPFWNPYSCCGTPYVGNPQSALWYPPNWLCWLLDARDVLSWLLVGHHVFAGVGTYLLCRRYGFGWIASVAGGVIFECAPYLIAHTGEGHYAQIGVISWMPWAFLAYESLRHASTQARSASEGATGNHTRWRFGLVSRPLVVLAAVLAMSFLGGHAQEFYYLVLILTVWTLIDAVGHWRANQPAAARRRVAQWLVLGLGTAGLVAIDLLPAIVFTRQMVRSAGLSAAEAGKISLSTWNLLQIFNPFALGGPQSYGGPDKFFWESLCSFGLAPLVLAVAGVVLAWRRHPVARLVWTWLAAFAFAFGSRSPVFWLLFKFVPGVSLFRVPSRTLFFCSLGVAILAAAALDAMLVAARDLSVRLGVAAKRLLMGLAVACVFVLLCGIRLLAAPRPAEQEFARRLFRAGVSKTAGNGWTWCWLLVPSALVAVAIRRPAATNLAVAGLVALCLVELGWHANQRGSSQVLTTIPAAKLHPPGPPAGYLSSHAGLDRTLARQYLLNDREAWQYGLFKVQGYDPVPLARYVSFFAALTQRPDPVSDVQGFSALNLPSFRENLLDLLGVRFCVLSRDPPKRFGWRLVDKGEFDDPFPQPGQEQTRVRYFTWENPNALPRAFVIGNAFPPPSPLAGEGRGEGQAALANLDPRRELLLDPEALYRVFSEFYGYDRADFAPAKITEYTPNRVTIEAELSAPGYLVLSDVWYPGWIAIDNGTPIEVQPADVAFRAVPLEPGKHQVVFRYQPVGLLPGAVISAATWFVLIASLFVARRGKARVDSTALRRSLG